ncbi:MAG: hypothetical protein U0795_17340 [Pirellulales bacterium]
MRQVAHQSIRSLVRAALLAGCLLAWPAPSDSDEPKYHDRDVVYDESKVPPYDLPELLVTAEG